MTLYSFRRVATAVLQNTKYQSKPLFYWVTVMFNSVDTDRIKQIGPDRACAEWLLRNGAFVRWVGSPELLTDYNALPSTGNCHIEAVDANNAGICDVGFPHFEGCKHIKEIKLENCKYIDNKAMPHLSLVKDTLTRLEIIKCKGVDDNGLHELKVLKNLKILKIRDLPGVEDNVAARKELLEALPNCEIEVM